MGNSSSQTAPATGKVDSLHPINGAILTSAEYVEAATSGTVTNNYTTRAIRGRIIIQVQQRDSANQWTTIDTKWSDHVLIDASSSGTVDETCAPGLPTGNYVALVWLQWQEIGDDPEDSAAWRTLVGPSPTVNEQTNETIDPNSQHTFTIYPSPPQLPEGLVPTG